MHSISDFRVYLIDEGIGCSRTKSLETGIHTLWRAICELDNHNLRRFKKITVNKMIKKYGEIYPMNRVIDLEENKHDENL